MTAVLDAVSLKEGKHYSRDDGMCAAEAIAWMAGEPHTDHPACLCPVIGAFIRSWNDSLPSDADRDRLLKPLLPLAVGTANATKVELRAFQCIDWMVRTFTPAWLDLVEPLKVHAEVLRRLPEIDSWERLAGITPILADAQRASVAAWDAARDAASVAAWAAARDAASVAARDAASVAARAAAWAAAWVAAWDAARDAAWDAARAAARDAASVAARAAARDAASVAARDAAWAAARAAAWAAAWVAARVAARDAARDALKPATTRLQESAADLVKRMCAA